MLPHLYTFGDIAFFDAGGMRLFLAVVDEAAGEPGESVLYCRVDDIHGASGLMISRGVVFTDAPHLIHRHGSGIEEWMAFFTDLDGRPLALMARMPPEDAATAIVRGLSVHGTALSLRSSRR